MKKLPRRKKPRISPKSAQYLARIARYIQQFDIRGAALAEAASDELDGLVYRYEIDELVRRRLLSIVPLEPDLHFGGQDSLAGQNWTVSLTQRAINLFWPDRTSEKHNVALS